jgi:hypothetical protein
MQTVTRPDGSTLGVCFASLHGEPGPPDAWLDVILGTFGEDISTDHVTFGCRVLPATAPESLVISVEDAAAAFAYRPIMGRRLKRDEALSHTRYAEFRQIVDLVVAEDPQVRNHVRDVY